ncbi:hypothetical protein [Desulfosporosinus sp. SB140]|uniref:hypothetical protein n=1 Tax=Desulfosporosinus paludis TaxID=3115649 RepID=UPI003890AAB0
MSTLKSKLASQLSKSDSLDESDEESNDLVLVPETVEQPNSTPLSYLVQVVPEFALTFNEAKQHLVMLLLEMHSPIG